MNIGKPLIRNLARFGYLARGLVYLTVGGIAMQAALDLEQAEDIRGAMQTIVHQQYGVPVLLAIAAGLIAFAVWRLAQSLFDVDAHGYSLRGLGVRSSLLISAGLHVGLALASIEIALNIGSGEGTPVRALVAQIFAWPYGAWLVGAGGFAIGIAGFGHLYKAAVGGFRLWFDAGPFAMAWIDPLSRFGLCARGFLFLITGVFVVHAAITFTPDEAAGLKGALLWVQKLKFGRGLLGIAAAGLLAFGAYSVIEAFVRRVGVANRD